eukprot:4743155-Amphidinium_carterae.2
MGYPSLRRQPSVLPLLVSHDALLNLMSMASPTTSTWCHDLQERGLQDSFIGPYHGSHSRRCQRAAQ